MRLSKLIPTLAVAALLSSPAMAQVAPAPYAPDDVVYLDLSTEGFVSTKTAKVTVGVSAAASDDKASTLRADMQKAVSELSGNAEWRLTSFNRSQDSSGLTRWDASYEARVTEKDLGGLNDRAKKVSKPGLQLRVDNIDFTPTLAEVESRKGELRTDLYKRAQDELARLNSSLPGRTYRISDISFGTGGMPAPMMARPMMMKAMRSDAMMAESAPAAPPVEVAQQLTVTARVVLAARPPVLATPDSAKKP